MDHGIPFVFTVGQAVTIIAGAVPAEVIARGTRPTNPTERRYRVRYTDNAIVVEQWLPEDELEASA